MKINLTIFFMLVLGTFWGCASDYDYKCGKQVSGSELASFATQTKPSYNVDALKLLARISNLVFVANGEIENYSVQFQKNDRASLVIQVYGVSEPDAIDKTACAVFAFKEYIYPPEVILLFYKNKKKEDKPELVVGLRK